MAANMRAVSPETFSLALTIGSLDSCIAFTCSKWWLFFAKKRIINRLRPSIYPACMTVHLSRGTRLFELYLEKWFLRSTDSAVFILPIPALYLVLCSPPQTSLVPSPVCHVQFSCLFFLFLNYFLTTETCHQTNCWYRIQFASNSTHTLPSPFPPPSPPHMILRKKKN